MLRSRLSSMVTAVTASALLTVLLVAASSQGCSNGSNSRAGLAGSTATESLSVPEVHAQWYQPIAKPWTMREPSCTASDAQCELGADGIWRRAFARRWVAHTVVDWTIYRFDFVRLRWLSPVDARTAAHDEAYLAWGAANAPFGCPSSEPGCEPDHSPVDAVYRHDSTLFVLRGTTRYSLELETNEWQPPVDLVAATAGAEPADWFSDVNAPFHGESAPYRPVDGVAFNAHPSYRLLLVVKDGSVFVYRFGSSAGSGAWQPPAHGAWSGAARPFHGCLPADRHLDSIGFLHTDDPPRLNAAQPGKTMFTFYDATPCGPEACRGRICRYATHYIEPEDDPYDDCEPDAPTAPSCRSWLEPRPLDWTGPNEPLGEPVRIRIDTRQVVGTLSSGLHAANLDGAFSIWPPEQAQLFHELEAERVKEARLSFMRWPSGCVVDYWPWPAEPTVAAATAHHNRFTLADWLSFVLASESEPLVIVSTQGEHPYRSCNDHGQAGFSYFEGTAAHAAQVVEFFNAPATAAHPWAKLREALGRPQPLGVRTFQIGNEPYSDNRVDEFCEPTPTAGKCFATLRERIESYGRAVVRFAAAMRAVDSRAPNGNPLEIRIAAVVPAKGTDPELNTASCGGDDEPACQRACRSPELWPYCSSTSAPPCDPDAPPSGLVPPCYYAQVLATVDGFFDAIDVVSTHMECRAGCGYPFRPEHTEDDVPLLGLTPYVHTLTQVPKRIEALQRYYPGKALYFDETSMCTIPAAANAASLVGNASNVITMALGGVSLSAQWKLADLIGTRDSEVGDPDWHHKPVSLTAYWAPDVFALPRPLENAYDSPLYSLMADLVRPLKDGAILATTIAAGPSFQYRYPWSCPIGDGCPPAETRAYPYQRAMTVRAPDSTLWLLTVNAADSEQRFHLALTTFQGSGRVLVRRLRAAHWNHENSFAEPDAISLESYEQILPQQDGEFVMTVPKHSVTLLELSP